MDTEKELTENQKTLASINATLLNRATSDQQGYMIGTRRLDRIPLEELRIMRLTYITAVRTDILELIHHALKALKSRQYHRRVL